MSNIPSVIVGDIEWATISHIRGYCHDGSICKICVESKKEFDNGYNAAINKIATGE